MWDEPQRGGETYRMVLMLTIHEFMIQLKCRFLRLKVQGEILSVLTDHIVDVVHIELFINFMKLKN